MIPPSARPTEAMLQATDLHYRAGGRTGGRAGGRSRGRERDIVRGVDLTVAPGEIVGLVGPNGAGKSTLLRCLSGVLPRSRGDVRIDGRAIEAYAARALARTLAYVPQQESSAISLSVAEMIALGRAPHRGQSSAARDREVLFDVMARLSLEPFALRPFGSLSGGERQRVLLARAMAQESRLLLLDEPTSALDLRHQFETLTLVRELARTRGLAVLLAIHDLALASRFADRLILLHDGRVHADGRWQTVLTPHHIETVYGIGARIGVDEGLPYVIPTGGRSTAERGG